MTQSAGRWRSLSDLAQHLVVRQDWLPLREAARLYRVTPETMQSWASQGHFRSCRIHSATWVSRVDLESGLRRTPEPSRAPDRPVA
jgi:hypothetical protein